MGKEFDLILHEAIMCKDSESTLKVLSLSSSKGVFAIGDKLLRPPMVKVSSWLGYVSHKTCMVSPNLRELFCHVSHSVASDTRGEAFHKICFIVTSPKIS